MATSKKEKWKRTKRLSTWRLIFITVSNERKPKPFERRGFVVQSRPSLRSSSLYSFSSFFRFGQDKMMAHNSMFDVIVSTLLMLNANNAILFIFLIFHFDDCRNFFILFIICQRVLVPFDSVSFFFIFILCFHFSNE